MKKSIVGILLLSLLSGGVVLAFVFAGDPPYKWGSADLPRNIVIRSGGHSTVNDGDGGVAEIADAIANSWNQAVPGNLTTTTVESNPPASIGDGISTMHFNVIGTGCSGGCLAVTITPIPPSNPTETVNGIDFRLMGDSDIFFNPKTKFYSDSEADGCQREVHIESVAVHEVGHVLGLGHTPVSSATMFASTAQCNNSGESLAPDDIDGINCAYNNGAGCGGCVPDTLVVDQTSCSQPSSGPNAGDFVVETFIVDNCGTAAAGATVTIDIPTSPLGPLSCSGDTSSTGRLGCALDNPPDGLYESLVASVAKSGFDWPGSECRGVGQPPCGCGVEIGGGGCTPSDEIVNGVDDDCDGLVDCDDPDVQTQNEKGPRKNDGLDNDCNGVIDG